MTTRSPKLRTPILPPSLEHDRPDIRSGHEASPASPEVSSLLPGVRSPIPTQRLIVLVPNQDIDESTLARRIWEIASPPRLSIVFFGLCRDIDDEAQMRRRLTTLSALTRDPRVKVETRLEFGKSWTHAIKAILHADDIIVCHAEQRAGFWHKPLSRVLETLGAPVWTLSGFYEQMNASMAEPLKEIIFWVISIAILIGFTFIQIRVVRLSKDWAQSALLYLSILVEAGLLWAWHHLSS